MIEIRHDRNSGWLWRANGRQGYYAYPTRRSATRAARRYVRRGRYDYKEDGYRDWRPA